MQNKSTYEFAVIRLVPKVEREEFINIGVILFSKPQKFLEMRYQVDKEKLQVLYPKVEVDEILAYLQAWEAICIGGIKGGKIGEMDLPSRFRWLVASRSTILQSSPTHTGICDHPLEVLENLFSFYVL